MGVNAQKHAHPRIIRPDHTHAKYTHIQTHTHTDTHWQYQVDRHLLPFIHTYTHTWDYMVVASYIFIQRTNIGLCLRWFHAFCASSPLWMAQFSSQNIIDKTGSKAAVSGPASQWTRTNDHSLPPSLFPAHPLYLCSYPPHFFYHCSCFLTVISCPQVLVSISFFLITPAPLPI